MAWPVPNVGQWNPGLAMGPDASGNMSSLTPEQWTIMQQQNWQQWTQWQQQYAQWQSQYGDKYVEQVQAIQAMGMPPPPPVNNVPPPAPPPPEKPPPPPPHENDQPLYGNSLSKIPTQYSTMASDNNFNTNTGNNQNRSYDTDAWNEVKLLQAGSAIDKEALKKLAEEERLFDIQFQKWEEEIQKWKTENVNHPDKQAYSEYEQKFEACRDQLLERRQQMKIKRAKLLSNTPQPANSSYTGNVNISSYIPPTVQNTILSKPNTNIRPSHQISKSVQNYPLKNIPQYLHYTVKNEDYNRSNNKNIDPQDRFESYVENNENYVNNESNNSSFLPISFSSNGIPGLDLVPDMDKGNRQEVIDISGDSFKCKIPAKTAPDYSTISQGINSILGDEKIMNILSMVKNQKPAIQNTQNVSNPTPPAGISMSTANQWNKSDSYNNQCDNRHPGSSFIDKQRPIGNIDTRQPPDSSLDGRPPLGGIFVNRHPPDASFNNLPIQGAGFDNRQELMQYDDKHFNNVYDDRAQNNFDNRKKLPINNQNVDHFAMNQVSIRPDYSEASQTMYDLNCKDDLGYSDKPLDQNRVNYNQYSNPNIPPRGGPPASYLGPPNRQMNLIPSQNTINPKGFNRMPLPENVHAPMIPPPKPKWVEEPLFTPSIIVEYEHKPLRLKARDFIEPVHTFDYNHKCKDSDVKKRDFEREVYDLFPRKFRPYNMENDENRSQGRDLYSRDYDRRKGEEDFSGARQYTNDYYHEEKSRLPDRYNDRRDDREVRFSRREDNYRERDRDLDGGRDPRDRERDYSRDRDVLRGRDRDIGRDRDTIRDRDFGRERDGGRELSRDRDAARERDRDGWRERRDVMFCRDRDRERQGYIRDIDNRKRGPSLDSEVSNASSSKKAKDIADKQPKHIVMIDDLLEPPGREMRPDKILIILRGVPGSGKSYLAKLIRDREAEHGGTVRIMSIDDYFMQEGEIEETEPVTGKLVKKPSLKYEYDEQLEESYITSLKRALKRSITDGYFSFIVFDAVNDQLKSYADMWNFARQSGFQVYICTMDLDPQTCHKRNIHNRKLDEIEDVASRFFPTPAHHIHLDPTSLLQNAAITEVQMEDADVSMEDAQETEVENSFTSKWERMDDVNQLARLDGTSKPLRQKLSMEDYLQLDDWIPNKARPGKKSVRWADLEERREQEKLRAIGFVVGQTDWNRMTDPTLGSSALTQTKYIERVRRN